MMALKNKAQEGLIIRAQGISAL